MTLILQIRDSADIVSSHDMVPVPTSGWTISSMLVRMTPHESRIQKRQRMHPTPGGAVPANEPPCDVYSFNETRVVVARSPKTTAKSDKNNDSSVPAYAHPLMGELNPDYGPTRTSENSSGSGGNPLHTPMDKSTLMSFYCSKIHTPTIFWRFYLSNLVMSHDPRSMLAASAFLALTVKDFTILVECLKAGTGEMNALVPVQDILDVEVRLMWGVDFKLFVFSPYKTVLLYTEVLRMFLKTEHGAGLATFPEERGGKRSVVAWRRAGDGGGSSESFGMTTRS